MKMSVNHNPARGQTSVEYLLLLAVVAVVVIAAFGPGSLIDQIHKASGDYYNTVTTVIMDSDNTVGGKDVDTPAPIAGGWCPVTCPPAGSSGFNLMYGACECPAPAFGGANCPSGTVQCGVGQTCKGQVVTCGTSVNGGPPVTPCGPCPTGQQCSASGQCVCADGLVCPSGSSPDSLCTKCDCNSGGYYNGSACVSCDPCFIYNGSSCVPVSCGANMYCDSSLNSCQCDSGSYYNGASGGCIYCATGSSWNGTQCITCPPGDYYNGTRCVPGSSVKCPKNMFFDTTPTDPGYLTCQCESPTTCWNGTTCVKPSAGQCVCNAGTCPAGHYCGPDTCGNVGGCSSTCKYGSCDLTVGSKTYGQCVCTPNCTGKECGSDGCVGICGTCEPSSQSQCNAAGQCVCTPNCSGKQCGDDGCGGSCGSCASGKATCTLGQCVACTPNCNGVACGSDGCGGTCPFTCGVGNECTLSGTCCAPKDCNALGLQCGDDGCGGSCGTPPPGQKCFAGKFCDPNLKCSGKQCGDDGCGDPDGCGTCNPDQQCNANQQCECSNPHQCPIEASPNGGPGGAAQCGPDTCGNANGCDGPNACKNYPGSTCFLGGCCLPECKPYGLNCGSDGCGGTCGICTSGLCISGRCVSGPLQD